MLSKQYKTVPTRESTHLEGISKELHCDSILDLIEQQAKIYPSSIAVIDKFGMLDYEHLEKVSNQLANCLIDLGVKPGMLVGISLARTKLINIAYLAVLKIGAAYVPIDPRYPKNQISYMLKKSSSEFLLIDNFVEKSLKDEISILHSKIVNLEKNPLEKYSVVKPEIKKNTSDLAYVIYTSGSTGDPKGVMISHRNLLNVILDMQERLSINPEDKWLALSAISFDMSGLELFLPLISGACCVIADHQVSSSGKSIKSLIKKHDVNILQATPSTWKLLLDEEWKPTNNFKIICGGEGLTTKLASQLRALSKNFWNLYGPTETTIWSSACMVDKEMLQGSIVSIGKPITNTELYILDHELNPVHEGNVGELYIGGLGVGLGYWDDKNLTQERFINSPFNNKSLIYKTGDLARLLSDGNVEYIGRVDHQVKLNGYRIELSAIEALLLEYNGIKEAIVVIDQVRKLLVAYIVKKNEINLNEVSKFLSLELPIHMLPKKYIIIDAMPLTPTKKIDRKRLSELANENAIYENKPKNSIEESLVKIWEVMFFSKKIGINDNFFELGGNSILVLHLIDNIKRIFNVDLKESDIYATLTIENLSNLISSSLEV